MSVNSVASLFLVTYEGNEKTFTFRFFQARTTRIPLDLSGVDSVNLEAERQETEAENLFAPLIGLDADIGADYVNGIVPITVPASGPSGIAEFTGTYRFSLTQFTGGVPVTLATGQIEVRERPGYEHP